MPVHRPAANVSISIDGHGCYRPAAETAENLALMALIDRQYTARPFYGSRRMTAWLRRQGHPVNRKRVRRLLGVMGLEKWTRTPTATPPRP